MRFDPTPFLSITLISLGISLARGESALQPIVVSEDGTGFVQQLTEEPFIPVGFNYDHDEKGRLIEDYWLTEWPKIEEDFGEMKALGANVVRVHLQLSKFITEDSQPNRESLQQLAKLVALAESVGLYLDLTGLGCYHKQDVPKWYDLLSEEERWQVQALFWEHVARTVGQSPAIFCYDLMNEPVVPGGKRKAGDWLGPPFAGKHFVQFITLDTKDRPRPEIATRWIETLSAAIRKHDSLHLITVGLVHWSLDRPGLTSGFVPEEIAESLDFLSVHVYPETGKVDAAIETVKGFQVGKPLLIEETFPLRCSIEDFDHFVRESDRIGAGILGFYWGKAAADYEPPRTIADAMTLGWLRWFEERSRAR